MCVTEQSRAGQSNMSLVSWRRRPSFSRKDSTRVLLLLLLFYLHFLQRIAFLKTFSSFSFSSSSPSPLSKAS